MFSCPKYELLLGCQHILTPSFDTFLTHQSRHFMLLYTFKDVSIKLNHTDLALDCWSESMHLKDKVTQEYTIVMIIVLLDKNYTLML